MDLEGALARKAAELSLVRGNGRSDVLRGARRVRRGVFCTDPSRGPSYEEAVVAALLVLPAGTVACDLTAARLWRLDGLVPVTLDEPLEFLVAGRTDSVRLAGCRLTFSGHTGVDLPSGIPATSQARTLIDLAARLCFDDAVVLVEAALCADPTISDDLWRERRRRLPRRGRDQVIEVLEFAGPLSESVLESRARLLWRRVRLPVPVQQAVIRVGGRFVARVDFLWPAARLVVEVDGLAKYREPGALQAEKARQNALVAAGYTVLRFTWADVMQRPEAVVRQVRAALRLAS